MDAKTLEALGAVVTKIAAEYNRKLGDGNFGSIGASMTVEASLAALADPDVVANGLYEFCKAAVARNLKPEAVAARESVSRPTVPGPIPQQPPIPPPPVAQPLPVAQPAQQAVELSVVTLDAPTCAHLIQDGQHRFKVFGGKWAKFGVPVYEEVLKQYNITGWGDWPVCQSVKGVPEQGNRFALPSGFQKVEVEVNEAGKPIRVHAFR